MKAHDGFEKSRLFYIVYIDYFMTFETQSEDTRFYILRNHSTSSYKSLYII